MSSVVSVPPYLFHQEGTFAAPFEFDVPASLEVQPYTAHATFDGSGASGNFRPCLTFYGVDGIVLGRYFPADILAPGDVAEVTYTPPFGTAAVSNTVGFVALHCGVSFDNLAVNAAATDYFRAGTVTGDPIVDIDANDHPFIVADGLYVLSVSIFAAPAFTSTPPYYLAQLGFSDYKAWQLVPIYNNTTTGGGFGSLAVTARILAGSAVDVTLTNYAGVQVVFTIADYNVTKVGV